MASIVFITPFYAPERGAAAVRISETAERLVRLGHRVTILTTVPNYPLGVIAPGYRNRLLQQEMQNGVHIIRVWSYITDKKSFFHRILAQLIFALIVPLLGSKTVGRPDVIIVQSPPLFDAIAGRLLAWIKRCPFIFMVSDLWPESAIQLGALRNPLVIRLARWLERSTYQRAGLIWALSQGIRDFIVQQASLHQLPPERVFMLRNGADLSKFRPLPRASARAELGWDERFTVLYAGTFGVSHGLMTVIDASEQLREEFDIHFVFVGEGTEKAELVAQAHQRNLSNVSFLDAQPHERLPIFLAAADACLVPMKKLPLFEGRIPIKIFEIMACERPIVLGVDGETRNLVEQEAGAALYVEPENAEALAAALLYLRDHPDVAEQLGKRGAAFVKAQFDRDKLVQELDTHITALLRKQAPTLSAPSSAELTPAGSIRGERLDA